MDFQKYNQQQVKVYTSTGEKLFCHPRIIKKLREEKLAQPIVMSIMPTENCNLNCVFCSMAHRDKYPNLSLSLIKQVVNKLHQRGLKAVIISGGGEPLLYPQINELVEYLYSKKLEIGLITNGILLSQKLKTKNLSKFTWIRVSVNSLDYVPDIKIPKVNTKKTALGFSYIWNSKSKVAILEKIKTKIKDLEKNGIKVSYVRLSPDCYLSPDEFLRIHRKLQQLTKRLGRPFFHQFKIHKTPQECHFGRVHPVLYTDRKIYPCNSLALNSPKDDRKFHQDYAVCDWHQVDQLYTQPIKSSLIDTKKCPRCVFERQNVLLKNIIDGRILEVKRCNIKHKNFI